MAGVVSIISEKLTITNLNEFFINLGFAIILVVIGIILGKFIKYILHKLVAKVEIKKIMRPSFVELFLTVIKWSIYIIFLNIALSQLEVPEITNWITSALLVIPAFVGALIVIIIGFTIAVYLRDLIEESEVVGWQILSMIFFYFILFIFMIFAIQTALISQDQMIINYIILILTTVVSISVAYWHVKIRPKQP